MRQIHRKRRELTATAHRVADSGWFTAQLHMISNLILPGSTGQGWGTLAGHTAKADEIVLIPLNE